MMLSNRVACILFALFVNQYIIRLPVRGDPVLDENDIGTSDYTVAGEHAADTPCCLKDRVVDKKDDHVTNQILNQVFFPCVIPHTKPQEDICREAASRVTQPMSSLFPVKKFIYEGHGHEENKPHTAPKKHLLEDPVFVNHRWVSDRSADVVVVSKGCCYNVFLDVKEGEQLSSLCDNVLLGGTDELINLFGYSLITPGDAGAGDATGYTELSVLIGGDYKATTAYEFARLSVTSSKASIPGLPQSTGLFIGGFIPAGAPLTVSNGEGVTTRTTVRVQPVIVIERKEADLARASIAARACAVSKEIANMPVTAQIRYTGEGSNVVTDIYCPGTVRGSITPCVVHMTGEQVNRLTEGTINIVGGIPLTIKINVWDAVSIQFKAYNILPAVLADTRLVWNLPHADSVHVTTATFGNTFFGTIVAPVARVVIVDAVNISGSIIMGNPDSHVTVNGSILQPEQPLVTCPQPEATITFCDCLCADEKKKEKENANS